VDGQVRAVPDEEGRRGQPQAGGGAHGLQGQPEGHGLPQGNHARRQLAATDIEHETWTN
jgi:hypothetical protein